VNFRGARGMERKEDDKVLKKKKNNRPVCRTPYPRGIIVNNDGCEK
jgi:hypothetical protein